MTASFSTHKFIKGLLTGAAIGGGIGLLCAPRKGADLREELTSSVENSVDLVLTTKNDAQAVKEDITKVKDSLNTLLPPLIENTEKSINRFNFKIDPRITEIKQQLGKINQEIDSFKQKLT
ncbi:YtxH domain-containing protein [Vagococcus vulneris]|uniref:YtxH domain-containing protein n=1 Tax=Vagococcus vulneris TaxID=1977869 RepID=A0A429ZXE8_9ENTE|nr:YtxH domain-containing protein [Vagococcus vulneris]RST98542.1 hypothetical protein CBF37_07135 [Vagococcus vulneris]